jgi:hypothetical protein
MTTSAHALLLNAIRAVKATADNSDFLIDNSHYNERAWMNFHAMPALSQKVYFADFPAPCHADSPLRGVT